ncbi:MAG: ABC transporter permease subunit [Pirellulaceae bacterium]|jgi:hypothetical protein|nr:ABC transporter permease subunit [Pirellulaceae bacterium]MDP7015556.1 ABC transporter permease subunit [Pirellulaceae bacterium]
MVAYLAIIKDSFREALASRVLWGLLGVITLLLLLLAPLGYRERVTTRLQVPELVEIREFIDRVRTEGVKRGSTPSTHIWSKFDEKFQEDLLEFGPPKPGDISGAQKLERTQYKFVGELNRLIEDVDFYEPDVWSRVYMLTPEGGVLRKKLADDTATDDDKRRLNRLALEAAFPDQLAASLPTSLQFRYLTWDAFSPIPISRADLNSAVTTRMATVMKLFVGVIGVIVAILVTASIIPQTFEPGSLNLLLSKPISRSCLFIAKFLGGCAFTCLNAGYLIGGLWVLLGFRFGIWDLRILLCIPLYVFVFSIYYTISALAGVVWRNSLLCIGATIVFWLVCMGLGLAKNAYESWALDDYEFAQIIPTDSSLMAVSRAGIVNEWDDEKQRWREVFESDEQELVRWMKDLMPAQFRPVGAAYDAKADRLINLQRTLNEGTLVTLVGERDENWDSQRGASAPTGSFKLLTEPEGSLLVVSSMGLFRLVGDPLKDRQTTEVFGFQIPTGGGPYRNVGPSPAVILTQPATAAAHPESGGIILYSRQTLTRLRKAKARYELAGEFKVEIGEKEEVELLVAGDSILVAPEDGPLLIVDLDSMSLRHEVKLPRKQRADLMSSSPDGFRVAITTDKGRLRLLDLASGEWRTPRLRGQGDIGATSFTDDDKLLVTTQSIRVHEYDLNDGKTDVSYAPRMKTLEWCYRYLLRPVYYAFPKPTELDESISYLLAKESDRKNFDSPWTPIWSSLIFMTVVMLLACIYIERQEY